MKIAFRNSRHGFHRSMHLAVCVLVGAMAEPVHAQDGYYDDSWGTSGRLMIDVGPSHDYGLTMVIQPDGKLVVGGNCREASSGQAICAARLRPNGQFDLTFGPNETGRVLLGDHPDFPPTFPGPKGLALQSDGRIVMTAQEIVDTGMGLLVRLSAAGHPEATPAGDLYTPVQFSVHATAPVNAVWAVTVAPNGKIIVAGTSHRAGSDPPNLDFGIARFNADRSPDSGFGNGGARLAAFDLANGGADAATDIAVLPDNKTIVVGYAMGADGWNKAALLKLNADGSSDNGFGDTGRVWFGLDQLSIGVLQLNAVAIDRESRIVVAGTKQRQGSNYDFMVARLDTQGHLDDGFGDNGAALIPFDAGGNLYDEALDLALQSDGKILITGIATDVSGSGLFAVARLTADGQIDTTFGIDGKGLGTFSPPGQTTSSNDAGQAIAIGNGGIMVAGIGRAQDNGYRFGVSKIRLDLIFTDGFQ